MHSTFPDWLARAVPTLATAQTKLSELRRLESLYGDLDALYDRDELESLIGELTYSTEDGRIGRPNPSKLQIDGDLRNNLASYKSAAMKYARFRQDVELESAREMLPAALAAGVLETEAKLSLEKDLQAALRANIRQLDSGLTVADGGSERTVPSGRIDILAEDRAGDPVVIELKAVTAPRDAVAQILAYMGDIQVSSGKAVRGILVAPSFDPRAISAARMVPSLKLVTFGFAFTFESQM